MKSSVLPDHMLRCLSPQQRKALGQSTKQETMEKGEHIAEAQLQRLIYSELLRRGMFFHYSRTDRKTTTTVGAPDFAFPYHGKYIGVEVKTAVGKQSKEQKWAEEQILWHGGIYKVVRTFDEFLAVLKEYGS